MDWSRHRWQYSCNERSLRWCLWLGTPQWRKTNKTRNTPAFFMDLVHAGDITSRTSQTGILLYCNYYPIVWYSKLRNTVKRWTFDAELFDLRINSELITLIRYKVRIFGIPLEGVDFFCDDGYLYKSSSFTEPQLKRKHQYIFFS